MTVVVNSVKELGKAIKNKESRIRIKNPSLAKKVKRFKGIKGLSKNDMASKGLITASIGIEVVYIVGILVLGAVVLYALYKDYNVKVKKDDDELVLERKA